MYHEFSVIDTIKASWHLFKKNFVTIIVFSIISFILLAICEFFLLYLMATEDFWTSMLLGLILLFIQSYTTLGLYKFFFTLIDSEFHEFEMNQVLPHIRMVISYMTVILIIAFVVVTFSIILEKIENYAILHDIIEGLSSLAALYIVLRIMFFNTFIVDDRSGPLESLKQSFELTRGYILKILLILAIIVLFIAVPALLSKYINPFISLIIVFTYPFLNTILAVTYRKLIYSHEDVDDDVAETD